MIGFRPSKIPRRAKDVSVRAHVLSPRTQVTWRIIRTAGTPEIKDLRWKTHNDPRYNVAEYSHTPTRVTVEYSVMENFNIMLNKTVSKDTKILTVKIFFNFKMKHKTDNFYQYALDFGLENNEQE